MTEAYADVLIIGAGIAGCAAAIALAPRHTVIVLDRQALPRSRIGESLPGAALPLLERLGLTEAFAAGGHSASLGQASLWGSDRLTRRDSFADPHGPGWRLDRPHFELMLRKAATKAGALLHCPAVPTSIIGTATGWRTQIRSRGLSGTISCRFIILATGRSTSVLHWLSGSRARSMDKLICRYAIVPDSALPCDLAGFSLVEAAEEGWWYRATLPSGGRIVAYHTDADLPTARRTGSAAGFAAELALTKKVGTGVVIPCDAMIGRASARSQAVSDTGGADWCVIGDSACAFDPLSSQGIFNALYTGVRGGEAVGAVLNGDARDLDDYRARMRVVTAAYRSDLCRYYALEARYTEKLFWQRRILAVT